MLRIGELAELAGISTRVISHYQQIGLLPEAAQGYQLPDVVLLLRIRRLVELGLSLERAEDALAEEDGGELRTMLADLDTELAEQEQRIRRRRQRIAELLASVSASTFAAELDEVLADLDQAEGQQPGANRRERLIAAMYDLVSGELVPLLSAEQAAFADPVLAARMATLSHRFADLLGRSPDDPLVTELAEEAIELGPALIELIPPDTRGIAVGELRAAVADLDSAQARCLELVISRLRDLC